jgi:DNA-binding response OmpR family regulator
MSVGESGAITDIRATVLVADGEVLVRLAIAEYLRECGYHVIEAAGAAEARIVLEAAPVQVSAVLIGLHGPDEPASGLELARWVRQAHPAVEVVLAGSPSRAASAAGDLCEQGPLLARPYEPQAVLDRMRLLLARRPPSAPRTEPPPAVDPPADPAP